MVSVLLIAANFVREQRWALIALMAYVVVFGAGIAFVGGQSEEDTLFMLRSTSMYGLAFAGLLAASALHNERKSRRILAVLSKGIERGQYIAGLLAGVAIAAAVYCGTIVGAAILATHSVTGLGGFAVLLLSLYIYAAVVAMAFSTFLPSLFAVICAGLLLAGEGALGHAFGGTWNSALPSWTLVQCATNFGAPEWTMPWMACLAAALHAVLFWAVATAIFARRDIAVAVE
ncbi:MAG: hypothetical protein ACRD3E_18780 [Terriglobales bacterium]